MKCKVLKYYGNLDKSELYINEWLKENSNIKIHFVSATTTPNRIFIFYE